MARFVLLEHVWNGVHWDLMLEHGEVLRTWAIDSPVVAGRDLPARALADHRRLYLDYEGEISGDRGHVRRIDTGTISDARVVGGSGTGATGWMLNWSARWNCEIPHRIGATGFVDFPHGKLRLKDLSRRQDRPMEGTFGSIRSAGEPDLAAPNLKFLELHVLSLEIRRITHEDHRIPIFSRPFGVHTMVACILDNSIEDVVGGHGEDAGANLLEGQLDGVSAGYAGPAHDGDHRLDPPLLQKEGERDPVELEQHTRFVHFRRELVGEVGDKIFGQPGVDFLVREDGLPVRLIADIVAQLKALRHELLGFAGLLFARQENHVAIIRRLVGEGKPPDHRNRRR